MTRDIKTLYRMMLGLALMVVISMAFNTFAAIKLLEFSKRSSQTAQHVAAAAVSEAQARAQGFARAVQTSRYDAALISCEHTNQRHLNALQYVSALDRINPQAGVLATSLLGVLAPLRDGKNGRESCAAYARSEVALTLPQYPEPKT